MQNSVEEHKPKKKLESYLAQSTFLTMSPASNVTITMSWMRHVSKQKDAYHWCPTNFIPFAISCGQKKKTWEETCFAMEERLKSVNLHILLAMMLCRNVCLCVFFVCKQWPKKRAIIDGIILEIIQSAAQRFSRILFDGRIQMKKSTRSFSVLEQCSGGVERVSIQSKWFYSRISSIFLHNIIYTYINSDARCPSVNSNGVAWYFYYQRVAYEFDMFTMICNVNVRSCQMKQ